MNAPPKAIGLFPSLLGGAFDDLPVEIKTIHGGTSGHWYGTASVRRPSAGPGRWIATLARFPAATAAVPCDVLIDVTGEREQWTRRFGTGRPLRSMLYAVHDCLVEKMGLIALAFRLVPGIHGVEWELQRVALLGVRLPRRLFAVVARCENCADGYRFTVRESVLGLGELIAYDGVLHVRGS
jgi:hypothetical protein